MQAVNVLIVGSGAREHSLYLKLKNSPLARWVGLWPHKYLINAPSEDPPPHKPQSEKETYDDLLEVCKSNAIDLLIFGGEAFLAKGWSDGLRIDLPAIRVIGPSKYWAQLETDKHFAKKFMLEHGLPTPFFKCLSQNDRDFQKSFESFIEESLSRTGHVVIKATGIAAGKGVGICRSLNEAQSFVDFLNNQYPESAQNLLLEEFLTGRETSHFFYCRSGTLPIQLGEACDYKRKYDQDQGVNTGGMGAYTPCAWLTPSQRNLLNKQILHPLETIMKNIDYHGFLYVGILWVSDMPFILEFNVRLGDPECQAVQEADSRDWLALFVFGESPPSNQIKVKPSVNIVFSTKNYAESDDAPVLISKDLIGRIISDPHIILGNIKEAPRIDNQYILSGRCFNYLRSADSLQEAKDLCYDWIQMNREVLKYFHYRTDIGDIHG